MNDGVLILKYKKDQDESDVQNLSNVENKE